METATTHLQGGLHLPSWSSACRLVGEASTVIVPQAGSPAFTHANASVPGASCQHHNWKSSSDKLAVEACNECVASWQPSFCLLSSWRERRPGCLLAAQSPQGCTTSLQVGLKEGERSPPCRQQKWFPLAKQCMSLLLQSIENQL